MNEVVEITAPDLLAPAFLRIQREIDSDTVEMHLADAGAPTLIRKDENSPALYVLMPMRV